ncbi:asparaginase [Bacillus haynesii]|uniref:asparaginase n=1 Tax=Bacillus haynesii TaxID=1925021 RepID=UPI0022813657|nr:asparaginase [Bacillus haynesii]MCY8341304.1 asparaginase [Bacillus haynesii]
MENKKIILLSTGGTIASKPDPETGLLEAGAMTGEELSEMCRLPSHIDIKIKSVFQLPSSHMTFHHLKILKESIESFFRNEDVAGIVISHGTDTLEETSYFLDLVISDERPVVLTGSQRGPTLDGTDAFVNLRQAFLLAAHPDARGLGVTVLFNERVFAARYVKKQHASNVDGFVSPGFGYLGTADRDEIAIHQRLIKRETYQLIQPLPNVELIKCSLGSDGKFIDYAAECKSAGIIIEASGRGHTAPAILESARKAVAKGITVVLTTSADEGEVKGVYGFQGSASTYADAGIILGGSYDSKKARIKLAVLLAADQKIDKVSFKY